MLSALLAVFLIASICVSATILPREIPSEGWMADYFESYATYYARYLTLSCETKQGTPFFEQCCRPLLTAESLSDKPAECDPDQDDDLPYCDEDEDTSVATTPEDSLENPSPRSIVASKEAIFSKGSLAADANNDGYATYYLQYGVPGACGMVHSDSELIAAVDGERYGNLGEQSDLCGRKVEIVNNKNGKSVIVTIADACPGCPNGNSMDLSVDAFRSIATLQEGIVPISWCGPPNYPEQFSLTHPVKWFCEPLYVNSVAVDKIDSFWSNITRGYVEIFTLGRVLNERG